MNRRTALKSLFALSVSRSAASVGRHPLKVAVLGHTGRGNFGHGLDTMWLDLPGVSWVAVSDADSGGLNQVKAERPELAAFSSYEDLLTEIRPDVVAVAPRHVDQHHAMCLAAIHAGAKGLYVEKPFCRTPKEADEIIAACQQKHVRLAVAHRNRYHPALPVLKQALENGLIGQWLEIRARGKEDHRGGAQDLWVLGSHVINVATYLGGHASSVQGQLYQDGRICDTDDLREGDEGLGLLAGNEIHARWTLDHGLPLFFDSTAGHAKKGGGFGLQCIGTEGVVDLQMDKEPMIHVRLSSPFNPTEELKPWLTFSSQGPGIAETIPDLHRSLSSHHLPALDLLDSIHNDRSPICDVHEAAETVEMIHGVFASHSLGGMTVQLPLANRDHGLQSV